MAYILAVNPAMLGSIGNGMTPAAVFTATAIAAAIATIVMALLANLPIALAPGMGLNAFFTYTVVGAMGYTWQIALTAVFIEGLLFVLLSLVNVREAIISAIPVTLKKAVAVGIGFFIALIGLENAQIVVAAPTLITRGSFANNQALLGIIGIGIIAVLYVRKIPGSILLGILATTIIGIPFGITKIPADFNPVSAPAAPLLFQFDFSQILTFNFLAVLFTFLFVDIFDTVGTLVGVTTQAGIHTKDGAVPRAKQALLSDALGTIAGAALGTSTVTSYIESTAGVAAGGRTGLTALTTAVLFLAAVVLSPVFLLIPVAATASALVFVGFMMMSTASGINFKDPTEGIPAFLTIAAMPFFYSIGDGIALGIITYTLLKLVSGKVKELNAVTIVMCIVFVARFFVFNH
jgi:AGZA family xanthine/uracil permease-like MFS transporter